MNQKVNIYIETSCKGPVAKKAAGAWLVEYTRKSGKLETRGGLIYADRVTENELALQLVKSAFSIFTKPCRCRVFIKCGHVLNAMKNGWLWQWKKNGWIAAKGKMVRNAAAWRQCADVMECHTTEWTGEMHMNTIRMQSRIMEELSREHELPVEGIYLVIPVPEWNTK